MTEYILTYAGFSRTHAVCHVITADGGSHASVLVGSLRDNPGTSVVNGTEEIGLALSELLFDGAGSSEFTLYVYDPRGLPSLTPTFYRVAWNGEQDRFAMPTFDVVDPTAVDELQPLVERISEKDYTLDNLLAGREGLIHIVSPEIERRASQPRSPRVVAPGEFRAQFAPTVAAMMSFTDIVSDFAGTRRYAAADSPAMSELAAEQGLKRAATWSHPVADTHALGGITLRAAADNVRTFADAFDADRPPLYGHLVLARGAFEASVVAAWLNEPGISHLERVKRGLCERLLSAKQQADLDVDPEAPVRLADCLADAEAFAWSTSFDDYGKPTVDGTHRPSVPDGITRLLGRSPEARIGRILWKRLTAVSEVALWGLTWAVQGHSEPDAAGMVRAEFGTWSTQVATQAYCIVETLRVAAETRVRLMGHASDEDWRHGVRAITQQQLRLLEQITESQ